MRLTKTTTLSLLQKKIVNVDIDESFLDPEDESDENDEQKVLRTPPSLKIVRSILVNKSGTR